MLAGKILATSTKGHRHRPTRQPTSSCRSRPFGT
jgi:hypothetical protein